MIYVAILVLGLIIAWIFYGLGCEKAGRQYHYQIHWMEQEIRRLKRRYMWISIDDARGAKAHFEDPAA